MQEKTTHATGPDEGGRLAGVKRLELLSWRFNEAEVLRLSLLQIVHRQQPNALDVPLEESRLRFARWLVDHGQLSEELAPATEETLPAKEEKYPAPDQADAPVRPARISVGNGAGRPGAGNACREDATDGTDTVDAGHAVCADPGQRVLRGVWSRLRRGMSWFATFWHDLMRPEYPPYGMGSWGTWGSWGSYGPYDPYGPRNPWGDPRSTSDPTWYWMRYYRHDD